MISTPDRRRTITLIEAAMVQGAPQHKVCEILGISPRTYQRWTRDGSVEADARKNASRPPPTNPNRRLRTK